MQRTSNMRDGVSSAIQTPRISSKMLRCATCFQLSSRCLAIPMKHCLSCLIYYIKHSTQCFIGYPNTSHFIKNTPLLIVFSTLFSVFGYPDETLFLVFDILHQTLDTVFHQLSKHFAFHQKYSATHRIFNSLLGVWIFVLDILLQTPAQSRLHLFKLDKL